MEDQAIKQQRKESQPKPQADREQKPRNFWKPKRHTCRGRGKGTGGRDQKRQSANDPPCASPHCTAQAALRSWFISGNVRIRLPVAAKIALSTAGAATAIVGSPTPPQKSPVGTTTTSTFGISSMRITL